VASQLQIALVSCSLVSLGSMNTINNDEVDNTAKKRQLAWQTEQKAWQLVKRKFTHIADHRESFTVFSTKLKAISDVRAPVQEDDVLYAENSRESCNGPWPLAISVCCCALLSDCCYNCKVCI
jgi:hypothetical protein